MPTLEGAPKNGNDTQCREVPEHLAGPYWGTGWTDTYCRSGRRGSGHGSHWPRSPSTPPDRRDRRLVPQPEDALVQHLSCWESLSVLCLFDKSWKGVWTGAFMCFHATVVAIR